VTVASDACGSVTVSRFDEIAVIEMSHGKANPLDAELIAALRDELAGCAASPAVRSVVVTGAGRVFSAGVDLRRMLDEDTAYTGRLLTALGEVLTELFSFPKPTVAAINGHAVAGGCIIACACDLRIAAEGARIGVTELSVGVAFPVSAMEIIRHVTGLGLEGTVFGAELLELDAAIAAGMVHEAVEASLLHERALQEARRLGSINPRVFELTKGQMRAPALERIGARLAFDAEIIEQWVDAETRSNLQSQFGSKH
jgi:enoyl-CoA hydratase